MFRAFRNGLVSGVGALVVLAAIGAGRANAQWFPPPPSWSVTPYNTLTFGG